MCDDDILKKSTRTLQHIKLISIPYQLQ